jgi:hypothetical protein
MVTPTSRPRVQPSVPPLEAGDHLTRAEFERRYRAMADLKKAELIEGVVFMPSPVRLDQHGSPHADLITWLGVFRASTPGVRVGDNSTVRLDLENEPQPDALLISEPEPLNTKLRVYRRNNVKEYIVWRVLDQAIDWFVLRQSQYDPLPLADGVYRSEVFPGLWLDPAALTRFDLATVLQVLQRGVASAEHGAFVTRLRQARPGTP